MKRWVLCNEVSLGTLWVAMDITCPNVDKVETFGASGLFHIRRHTPDKRRAHPPVITSFLSTPTSDRMLGFDTAIACLVTNHLHIVCVK